MMKGVLLMRKKITRFLMFVFSAIIMFGCGKENVDIVPEISGGVY